jgi:23S rRNA pseudouridine1911/1915/1917 synthase
MPTERVFLSDGPSVGERLDVWLTRALGDASRARVQAWIEAGLVLVDREVVRRPARRLETGQTVVVTLPDPEPAEPRPEPLPLAVVHEDAWLLVLDKPAGVVVHPGAGVRGGTLVNALLHHVHDLSGIGGVLRPGIVHRLDRGTSGLLVIAKDDHTHRHLARQFAERTVEKEYWAIVIGTPTPPAGAIDTPIGRDPTHRQRMSTRASRGREAHTRYRVVERLDGLALLRIRILTGRTHQIRVHLASIGHPVAGDAVYRTTRPVLPCQAEMRAALRALERPALHATRLSFDHPASGARLSFESPLPKDLLSLLERARL